MKKGKQYHGEAADEFLRHDEYRNPKTPQGVRDRIKATSDAMRKYGTEQSQKTIVGALKR